MSVVRGMDNLRVIAPPAVETAADAIATIDAVPGMPEWEEFDRQADLWLAQLSGHVYNRARLWLALYRVMLTLGSSAMAPHRDQLVAAREVALEIDQLNPRFGGMVQLVADIEHDLAYAQQQVRLEAAQPSASSS
ncbi:hypothetical protein HJC99_05945 [Candidatus Saccharibacteria bacterium]|nr:hypothetical protein [Candidatus Saccharibacteria bacterium]